MAFNLTERVLKTIRNYDMLRPGDCILVCVSGGPDSVFLLLALDKLRSKLKIKLAVCNLDHGLRGKESEEDSCFVKNLSRELGVEFIHKRIDVRKIKSSGLSTEEVARDQRYKFYFKAVERVKATVIATGHTLDDQAETILMRLIKGSSLKGLVGISPVREEAACRIIRPLIELEKNEITQHLDDSGISYRIDHTNLEPIYFRNVVRSEIMPFLQKYNPRLKRVLSSLAEHLREDFEFISREKARVGRKIARIKAGRVEIELKDIAVQPRAIQKEILRDSLENAGGEVKKLSFRHWKEIENLIRHKRKGNSVDLPGGVRATRNSRTLEFYKQ